MSNGYTKINNVMFEELSKLDISAHELRVLLFIIRYTVCFKRQYCDLSVGFISNGTGISERQVKRVIKKLIDYELIEIKQKAIGSHSQKIKILGDIQGQSWGHFRSSLGDMGVTNKGDMGVTQEIKENKNKRNKKEEKASPLFSDRKLNDMTIEEARAIKDSMTPEEWEEYMRTH